MSPLCPFSSPAELSLCQDKLLFTVMTTSYTLQLNAPALLVSVIYTEKVVHQVNVS